MLDWLQALADRVNEVGQWDARPLIVEFQVLILNIFYRILIQFIPDEQMTLLATLLQVQIYFDLWLAPTGLLGAFRIVIARNKWARRCQFVVLVVNLCRNDLIEYGSARLTKLCLWAHLLTALLKTVAKI